jgi:predicted O-methyltransferase YrrM
MTASEWTAVDRYLTDLLVGSDPVLEATLEANAVAGLPPYDVSPNQGKLLHILARGQGARRILEIGTLGGYSSIWLARALLPDGHLITLEIDPRYAEVARANLTRAGLSAVAEVRVGAALETLPQIAAGGEGPFDVIFIDADKANNPQYLAWSLELSRRGSLIVVDNVVRNGAVIDGASNDPTVRGARRGLELLAAEPRVSATAIQTVGSKGWDGFAVAVVICDR